MLNFQTLKSVFTLPRVAPPVVVPLISIMAMSQAANAQVSINTIGASEAVSCSQNAFSNSRDLTPCNAALRQSGTTRQDRIKTLINRGVIYNNRFEVQSAINDFNSALKSRSYNGEAYANRGNSYFLAERYEQALDDYERALKNNVSMPWAIWYNIGLTRQYMKQDEKAIEAFRKSLEFKPDFKPALDKLNP